MKKLLLLFLISLFQSFFGQIEFGPYSYTNHSLEPYNATITGNGTIYYTTDGTDPSSNSPSGVNQVNVPVNQNIVLKARLGNGQIFSRKYFVGKIPVKAMYFKPPASWNPNFVCSFINWVQPETMVDFYGPGNKMTAVCEGWFKSSFPFYETWIWFNNCSTGLPPYYQGVSALAEDTIFYDYSEGPISNPPACLLAVNDASKKIAIVKIFPNPVQDFVNIESDKNFIAYEMIDESGKSILNRDFKGTKIDISNLKTGIYFIKLKSLNNETNIVKFIKK